MRALCCPHVPAALVGRIAEAIRTRWPAAQLVLIDSDDALACEAREGDLVFLAQLDGRSHGATVSALAPSVVTTAVVADGAGDDELDCLEHGADDCISLSASADLIAARIAAVLRRRRTDAAPYAAYSFGPLRLNTNRREAFAGSRLLPLTRLEFDLLLRLIEARGDMVRNEDLQRSVWGSEECLYLESMRKYISRLRKKLEDTEVEEINIISSHGLGYRLLLSSAVVGGVASV